MERVEDFKEHRVPKSDSHHWEEGFEAEWYVVFHRSYCLPFWQWVFTLGTPIQFGHMFCFSQTGPLVVFLEPSHAGVQIEFKYDTNDIRNPVYAQDYANAYAEQEGWTVVRVKHNPWGAMNVRHLMNFIPSCVTVIKIVLGLPAPCLTPYAYYKYLIRSGKGEEIHGRSE